MNQTTMMQDICTLYFESISDPSIRLITKTTINLQIYRKTSQLLVTKQLQGVTL